MSKDKHLANIDRVLLKAVSTNSNLENKSKILFTEAVQASGEFLKVAFDVYRSVNDPYNGLWILEDINTITKKIILSIYLLNYKLICHYIP